MNEKFREIKIFMLENLHYTFRKYKTKDNKLNNVLKSVPTTTAFLLYQKTTKRNLKSFLIYALHKIWIFPQSLFSWRERKVMIFSVCLFLWVGDETNLVNIMLIIVLCVFQYHRYTPMSTE